ncbi:MAG: glutamine-hydrolyzing GMP synthase [Nanobdellota archaeon]
MERIIVIDFGGQYTQLIAKRVRECQVLSEIVPYDTTLEDIRKKKPQGIILSGGPASVYEDGAPMIDAGILALGIPVLGICYGMQMIDYLSGGSLISEGVKEYGETELRLESSRLFEGIDARIRVWMSHGDSVDTLPEGFCVIARTKDHVAGIANTDKDLYGIQFHPEVTHSQYGTIMIDNFVIGICGCKREWTPTHFIEDAKEQIRKTVGTNDVICFVSGGVDSSFIATLLCDTAGIGTVYPVYIEALMRKDETEEVTESLKAAGVTNLIVYRAEDEFISALEGLTDPEEKRKTIGNLFGTLQERAIGDLELDPDETFLAQGTLYTDLIESGRGVGKSASTIKSHHNVGCEFIENLKERGRLVEPNMWIFKDEVRKAAKEIGLPASIYDRQPFPGPGLGIRIVNGNRNWTVPDAGEADRIAAKYGLRARVAPVKTVGVQGDSRTYRFLCVLSGERNWKLIREAAREIPMVCEGINRVVYEITAGAGVRAIETTVTRDTVDQLKTIDYLGRQILSGQGISQTIFVLFGADLDGSNKRSVALRAVVTDDFMTARPAVAGEEISWDCLDALAAMVQAHAGGFVIDVTDKPPATTCWE